MKNYEELTNELLERRDRYVATKKEKRKRIMSIATSFSCVCLVALLGFGVWRSGVIKNDPAITPDTSVADMNKTNTDKVAQQITEPVSDSDNNSIRVLNIEKIPTAKEMYIALMREDFIGMNRDEINEYYGINVFPTVPSDLKERDSRLGVYKRKDTGELYCDRNQIQYDNGDGTRAVSVSVDKGSLPYCFTNLFEDRQTRSMINDIEVGIAHTPEGEFYAEFMYKETGFRVFACGLTQDAFVDVLESVIK